MSMNIVIVNDNASINGGAAKVAVSSAVGLAKRGSQVHFFCAVGPVAAELKGIANLTVHCTDQFEILDDPNRFRAITQGLWNSTAAAQFRSLLGTLSPDQTVTHVHTWAKSLSSSITHVANECGFRSVLTLHDYLYSCPSGTLFNHQKQQICRLKPMGAGCLTTNCDARNYGHKLWRVARQSVQNHSFANAFSQFVALTPGSLEILAPALPRNARVRFISNFVDVPRLPRVPAEQNRALIFSGRLVPEKGPVLLAKAAYTTGSALTYIGDGPCRESILQAHPGAQITGWLASQQALLHLHTARALVLPSLWYEAQPLVILEALALGIPVVLPDTCAARDLVLPGQTGLWFRAGDETDLAACIRQLNDPAFVRQLSINAFDSYWSDPPTLEKHLNALESLYKSVLEN